MKQGMQIGVDIMVTMVQINVLQDQILAMKVFKTDVVVFFRQVIEEQLAIRPSGCGGLLLIRMRLPELVRAKILLETKLIEYLIRCLMSIHVSISLLQVQQSIHANPFPSRLFIRIAGKLWWSGGNDGSPFVKGVGSSNLLIPTTSEPLDPVFKSIVVQRFLFSSTTSSIRLLTSYPVTHPFLILPLG